MKTSKRSIVIAIDGPAGSGKSTVSKIVARALGLLYIDSGAMYRALTLKAMRLGVDLSDALKLTELARTTTIVLRSESRQRVFLDGNDVTDEIRTPAVTNNIKYVAKVAGVRSELVKQQRAMGKAAGCVMEGRDITTVVFPDAEYKFYLDASAEERAKRRYMELVAMGQKVDYAVIRDDVIARDASDITRDVGPLRKDPGARVVDTTGMSIDEVVETILSTVRSGSS